MIFITGTWSIGELAYDCRLFFGKVVCEHPHETLVLGLDSFLTVATRV